MLKNSRQMQAKTGSSHTFVRINPRDNRESAPILEISGSEVTIFQQNPLPNTTEIQRALQGKLSIFVLFYDAVSFRRSWDAPRFEIWW